jgi:membrane-bound serine protease (ClpP class)
MFCGLIQADDEAEPTAPTTDLVAPQENAVTQVWRVVVPVPIVGTLDSDVREQIERVLGEMKPSKKRPILILQFEGKDGSDGGGSQFERSLALARYLASDRLSEVRTVAFIPNSLTGHAVLSAMACEQLIVDPDIEFGNAGIDETFVDSTVKQSYIDIASRRRTIPKAVAVGMLDPNLQVYRVDTLEGVHYVTDEDFAEFQEQYTVRQRETVIPVGEMGLFSGRQLRLKMGFATHLASNLKELAEALKVPVERIENDRPIGDWKAAKLVMNGAINVKSVSWALSSLQASMRDGTNFVLIEIDSAGGQPEESLRMAQWLADQDPRQVKTVAYVPHQALGDSALIALACDELVVGRSATIGGPGTTSIRLSQQESMLDPIKLLANNRQRAWSLYFGMIAPETELIDYRQKVTNNRKVISRAEAEELELGDDWEVSETIELTNGLTTSQLQSFGLVRLETDQIDKLKTDFGLNDELTELKHNWAHRVIARLAEPRWARTLLFFGFLMLMIECQQPGLSVPGFVSLLCFVLFFWGQFLSGTADWLEILLFAVGVSCILLEVFVIPGFGVFGIGGAVLVIVSIVLASQTFVLPTNSYQLNAFSGSAVTLAVGFIGIFASVFVVGVVLPRIPFIRDRMAVLTPEQGMAIDRNERMADFDHLLGREGKTTTRLAPSGKAKFGDEIVSVLSDSELIPKGADIRVIEVCGTTIRVERVTVA